jgi:gluconolactonase
MRASQLNGLRIVSFGSRWLLVWIVLAGCGSGVASQAEELPQPVLLWSEGEFTEGVAVAGNGQVYFSDIASRLDQPGRIMRYDPVTGQTSVFVANSLQSNGLFFDESGRLLACCGANGGRRGLCEVKGDGSLVCLVDQFGGSKLNSPNDLVVHPSGWVYLSDPRYVGNEPLELNEMSVYRFDQDGTLHRATTDCSKPNGVILSPGGKVLYVAETDNGMSGLEPAGSLLGEVRYRLFAYPVHVDGTLGAKSVLVDFGKDGGIDGMTTDTRGTIYGALRIPSRMGIVMIDPTGQQTGLIPLPEMPTNCTFGKAPRDQTLYVTAGKSLYRIELPERGYHPEIE